MAKLNEGYGFGQIELNLVSFRQLDGKIVAQCALDDKDFSEEKPAENGMILAVDEVAGKIKLPTVAEGGVGSDDVYALNYTAEHMYDEKDAGALRKFRLVPGEFYPRLGILSVGDKFTTNTVEGSDITVTDGKATVAESVEGKYASAGADGYITLLAAKPASGLALKVLKVTTMPDGAPALKFQVVA